MTVRECAKSASIGRQGRNTTNRDLAPETSTATVGKNDVYKDSTVNKRGRDMWPTQAEGTYPAADIHGRMSGSCRNAA